VVWGGTEWTDGGIYTRKGGVKSESRRRVHRTNGRTNGGPQKSGEIEEKRRGWRGREGTYRRLMSGQARRESQSVRNAIE
jgi:hypothetical protein